jgi:serine/threonine-protein kinase
MALFAIMTVLENAEVSHLAILTLIMMTTVTTRAVIVPATPRRAAWTSVLASVTAPTVTFIMVDRIAPPAVRAANPMVAFTSAAYIGLWALLAIVLAYVIARTIYGLQQKVKDATDLGQYTLTEKIGEGGMGMVFKARHTLLRRPTAVKLLAKDRAGPSDLARFEREVQLTSALTHPHTISIYDYGHTPGGLFYYVMEYLDGVTLEDLVTYDGPQPPARVVHVMSQVASALVEAHAVGLIHRDIKPANIMLCVRGKIHDFCKVLDFGLVKERDSDEPALSHADTILGTPLYLAPESIRGDRTLDGRVDIYALGAVAYQMLVGEPVFRGTSAVEVMAKHLHEAPEGLAKRSGCDIDEDLERLVLACLSKDPEDRSASSGDLFAKLETLKVALPWSQDAARAWWSSRSADVQHEAARARKEGTRTSGAFAVAETVAVDMHGRAAVST